MIAVFPDSAVGLYDDDGMLVFSNDDSGPQFAAQMSFGAGTRPRTGLGELRDGRSGILAPGRYYLAVTRSPASFGAENWDATSTATGTEELYL